MASTEPETESQSVRLRKLAYWFGSGVGFMLRFVGTCETRDSCSIAPDEMLHLANDKHKTF